MISMQEASEKLLEMFKTQEFGPQLALTIIKRRDDDPVNKLPCFHWSIGNHMLMWIIGQTDAAATYLQWKNSGRRVIKNAKAFPIFSPITCKVKKKKDDGTEEERIIVRGFRPVPVYRIEDTIGVNLDMPEYKPPTLPPLYKAAEALGIKVYWKPTSRPVYGYYRPGDNSITLSSTDYCVWFHEMTHAIRETLADTKVNPDREEIIAETTAAVLMEMQFSDHSYHQQSYDYIKYYCADKSPEFVIKTVMGVLKDVEEVVNKIMDAAKEAEVINTVAVQAVLFNLKG